MNWFITQNPAYDADFELPKNLQEQPAQAHAGLEQSLVTLRGHTVKPPKRKE